jgi:hypothetical protein
MPGTPTTKVAQQNTTVSGDVMISSPHARFGLVRVHITITALALFFSLGLFLLS